MNKLFLFAATVLLLADSGCTKPELPPKATTKTIPIVQLPPVARRVYAGLYVNSFDTILGDPAEEDTLLAWSKRQGFNVLTLYGVRDILLNNQDAALAAFCTKARSAAYGLDVAFVGASATTLNSETSYYQSRSLAVERQGYMITEYEFWNSPNSFSNFSPMLAALTNARQVSTSPLINRQVYVSRYRDAANLATPDTTIARLILDQTEFIVQVNYTANAYNWSATLQSRLQTIANAAFNKGINARVTILFNVNYGSSDPNIYSYFDVNALNHPFVDAYNSIRTSFNANLTLVHKSNVLLSGYQIYRYTEARQARP